MVEIPTPPRAMVALAAFVRDRLGDVSGTLAPLWRGGVDVEVVTSMRPDSPVVSAARQLATVVVGATAPFAPNAYARARLIRQMHATGLLTADEAYRVASATAVLDAPDERRAVVEARVVDEGVVDEGPSR